MQCEGTICSQPLWFPILFTCSGLYWFDCPFSVTKLNWVMVLHCLYHSMHVSLKKDRQCIIITKLYMCSHFVHMVLFSSCNLVQCRTVSKYNNTFGYAQALYFATVVTHTISFCSLIHYDNGVSICRRNMLLRTCRYHHQYNISLRIMTGRDF